jgi:hypothetical protein
MNNHRYDSADQFAKKLIANCVWGGSNYNFVGVPTRYGHARRGAGPIEFRWGGVDISDRFFRRAQSASTLRSSGSNLLFNTDLIRDICSRLQMSCDLSMLRPEAIRTQHRQDSRWGDLFQQALFQGAEWRVEGETLVCYQTNYSGAATWVYDSKSVVPEENLEADSPQIINQATARRGTEGGANQGATVALLKSGTYPISFNPPVLGLQFRQTPDAVFAVSDVICRNTAGVIVKVLAPRNTQGQWPPQFNQSLEPIASAVFTWGVMFPGQQVTERVGQVQFYGAPDSTGAPQDPIHTLTAHCPDSIQGVGQKPGWGLQPIEMPPNPLYYDSAAMGRDLNDFLWKHAFDLKPITNRVFLNHEMRPGDRVMIRDLVLGTNDVRYVEQCTHVFSDDPNTRLTRFKSILYPQSINVVQGKYK